MKKILFAMFAVAALASCAQDEIVGKYNQEAIGFGNAFVDNATKAATDPSYNNTNKPLTQFFVYGAVKGVNIFDGDLVSKGQHDYTAAWDIEAGTPTQYWIDGADYIFDAVVDATEVVQDAATKLPVTLKYDNQYQKDMLHDRVTTTGKPAENNGLVTFTFPHLLSKVKFTVTNTTASTATTYRYTISDIVFTANLTGDYKVADGTWENVSAGNYSIDDITVDSAKTEECAAEVLFVPSTDVANDKIDVALKVNVVMYDTVAGTWKTITTTTKTYTDVIALAANTAYNINITVGLDDDIKFTATAMDEWANGNTHDSNDADTEFDHIPAN